jgi:hypothetical protein
MKNEATEQLLAGRKLIDPIMAASGFVWEPLFAGQSSGGISDSGRYVKGDRNLELHFRWSLGMVTYHIARESLSHEEYMRQVAPRGGAQYPGFSEDPLDAFKDLAHDLRLYAQDFLSGSGVDFHAAKVATAKRGGLSGLQKLGGK